MANCSAKCMQVGASDRIWSFQPGITRCLGLETPGTRAWSFAYKPGFVSPGAKAPRVGKSKVMVSYKKQPAQIKCHANPKCRQAYQEASILTSESGYDFPEITSTSQLGS